MLIQKKLLEQLIELASDSAEYLNEKQDGKWITVKGNHIYVGKGETPEQAFNEFLTYADENEKNIYKEHKKIHEKADKSIDKTEKLKKELDRVQKLLDLSDKADKAKTPEEKEKHREAMKELMNPKEKKAREKAEQATETVKRYEKIVSSLTKAKEAKTSEEIKKHMDEARSYMTDEEKMAHDKRTGEDKKEKVKKPLTEEQKKHQGNLDKMKEGFDKQMAEIEKNRPTKEEEPKTEIKKEIPKDEPTKEDKPKDKTSKSKSFNVSGDIKKIGQSLKGLSEEEEKRK